jgi:hypothetical protein
MLPILAHEKNVHKNKYWKFEIGKYVDFVYHFSL